MAIVIPDDVFRTAHMTEIEMARALVVALLHEEMTYITEVVRG